MVIPAMDHIDQVFTNCIIKKEQLEPAIRAALGLAKRTLNRYYSLTDLSEVYRIAMGAFFSGPLHFVLKRFLLCLQVLHPRHKLSYFKSAGWTPEWIETAEELVRAVFQSSYVSHSVVDDTRDAREAQEIDKVRVGTILCILTVNPTF
jgi:hypothetical protein